jgi:hypothetical protein
MILFISYVQGFEQLPNDTPSMEIEHTVQNVVADTIVDSVTPTTPDWINLKQQDRTLSSSCNVCHKMYLYESKSKYKYPGLHGNYETDYGCQYSCCTDYENDPNCYKVYCPSTCRKKYVLHGKCPRGYQKAHGWWGKYEIGPSGPHGYEISSSGKKYWYKKSQCYYGCCSNDTKGSGCCVKTSY